MCTEVMDYSLKDTGEITKHWKNKINCLPLPHFGELPIQEACEKEWYCLEL